MQNTSTSKYLWTKVRGTWSFKLWYSNIIGKHTTFLNARPRSVIFDFCIIKGGNIDNYVVLSLFYDCIAFVIVMFTNSKITLLKKLVVNVLQIIHSKSM